jgi:hypothetical protein
MSDNPSKSIRLIPASPISDRAAKPDNQQPPVVIYATIVLTPKSGESDTFNSPGFAPVRQLAIGVIRDEISQIGLLSSQAPGNRQATAGFPDVDAAILAINKALGALQRTQWPQAAEAYIKAGLAVTPEASQDLADQAPTLSIAASYQLIDNLTKGNIPFEPIGNKTCIIRIVPQPELDLGLPKTAAPRLRRTNPKLPRPTPTRQSLAARRARDFWLLERRPHVFVIVGPDTRIAGLAGKNSDYSEISFIGDRDSVVEASVHIARLFPSAQILRYPASWLPDTARSSPLVVIGGPLGEDGRGGNRITSELMSYYDLPVRYELGTTPTMFWDDQGIPTTFDTHGQIASDGAMIAHLPNPWNSDTSIIMFQGTHTYGVLGGVRAFTEPTVAQRNTTLVTRGLHQASHFVAAFAVRISDGVLIPPILEADTLKLML